MSEPEPHATRWMMMIQILATVYRGIDRNFATPNQQEFRDTESELRQVFHRAVQIAGLRKDCIFQ